MSQSTFKEQFRLLLWKNWIMKIRRPLATIIEIIIPLTIILILMLVRNLQVKLNMDRCYLREKEMDSMGPLPFVRDLLCTFNSTCYNNTQINWNDTNPNDFQTFLNNFTNIYASFPTGNLGLPVLIQWMMSNPAIVQQLNYSLSYISNILSPVLQYSQMLSSNNPNVSSQGINGFAAFICGSNQNDINMFSRYFTKSSSRKKRYVESCKSTFSNFFGTSYFGKQIYGVLAPLIFGKIYYTPDSNFTRTLISKSNYSFVILDNLRLASIEWRINFRNWLMLQLTNSSTIDNLRNVTLQCINLNIAQIVPQCKLINNLLNSAASKSIVDAFTSLFSIFEQLLNCFELNKFIPVKSESEINNLQSSSLINVFGAVVFDPSLMYLTPQNATFLNYTIRMPTNRVDSTTNFKVLDRYWTPAPRVNTLSDMKYYTSGFIMLQEAIDRAFIEIVNNNQTVDIGSSMQIMPSPCYVNDAFIRFASNLMPFFLVIAWSPTFSILVKSIVYEKEKRLKEYMLVMGLSHLVHWMAWFTIAILTTLIPNILGSVILKYRNILEFSSPAVVFILFFSYAVSFITQAFMFSVFFNAANVAAVVAGLLYFIFYIPFLILINVQDDVTYTIYFLSGILPQVSFCNAINFIAYWEQTMEGAQFSNLFQSTVLNLNFGVGHCIIMLWVDSAISLIITWYVEAVFPGQYGIPKPWYFFVTKHYWCPDTCCNKVSISPYEKNILEKSFELNNCDESNLGIEKVPENLKVGISIQNLTKIFSKLAVPSVDNLNLNFYKSQITAFLGHNGAGKTTTISMLTGIYPPTSGTAYILGKDIRTDIDSIRKVLGLCPQHNILFDDLTVEDHIYFFGLLKGMSLENIKLTLSDIVEDVGLTKKIKTQSKKLSGGMKRKLSIAMAFIGNSKAIFLDEPTAGVDPFARRGIWDLLIKYRGADKTIILTTHHMDEADYLSDRIAIISQGKLKCCGSSVFLKRHFGDGYSLILVKSENAQKEAFNEINHSKGGNKILELIQRFVSNAKFVEETRTQWTVVLPLEGRINNGFSELFRVLDTSLDDFNITSYGLSDTSLEEVFLKVAEDPSKSDVDYEISSDPLESLTDKGNLPKPASRLSLRNRSDSFKSSVDKPLYEENNVNYILLSGFAMLRQQILGLQIKRFHYTKRNVKGLFAELILPVLMIVLIVGLLKMINPFANQPSMVIHPWLMMPKSRGLNLNTFYRKEDIANSRINLITDTYRTDLGESGIRCMNNSLYSLPNLKCNSTSNNIWSAAPNGIIPLISPECDCNKTGSQICSDPLSGGPPSSFKLMSSSDILSNLTGYNISDHLIKKFTTYAQKQYGGYQFLLPSYFGLSCKAIGNFILWNDLRSNLGPNNSNINFINYFQQFLKLSGVRTNYTRMWVNTKGYASMPAYANIFDNLLLRSLKNSSLNAENYGIVVSSYPFSYTQQDLLSMIKSQMFLEVSLSNFVILALSLIPASFVIFLIEERVTGSKRQQFVSGVNPYVYWISNFIWDILKYLASALLIVLIFVIFNYESYIGTKNVGAFIAILCGYGFAIIPHMYPFSFFISTPSTAFVVLSAYNMFVGSVTTITTFFLDQLQSEQPNLIPVNDFLKRFFLVFPQYGLGRGMLDISFQYLQYNVSNGVSDYNPLSWTLSGQKLASFGILFVFWSSVIFIIESGIIDKILWSKIKNFNLKKKEVISDEDKNVAQERDRVMNDIEHKDILRVVNLTKIYNAKLSCKCRKRIFDNSTDEGRRKLAVNNICFGVKEGECFGLLGVNGAGKTTTFKMLTGEELVTKGEASINGKSIVKEMVAAHKDMGFCPQFDALHGLLTCEEELYFYCRIRGIAPSLIKSTVETSFKNLSLTPHTNKTTDTLSGGNKRKLSTAISLVGSPKVIFMDEPTSGMDAGARRFLWNTIQKLTNQQRAVVLTSHNMEECEVLCHRLSIMVNGKFQCLGSVQELKSKFGDDYFVTLRMFSNCDVTGDREKIKNIIEKEFQIGIILKDENFVTLQYRMDPSMYKLYMIFEFFENLKTSNIIQDYSVSQTTLDDIFINFAKLEDVSKVQSTLNLKKIQDTERNCFVNDNFEDSEENMI